MKRLHPRIAKALDEQWGRPKVARVEVSIPVPPSVNELYRNPTEAEKARAKATSRGLTGRVKTERYRVWLRGAAATIEMQKPGRVAGPYILTLLVPRAMSKADIGNLEKPVSDLLQECRIIDNDRHAEFVISGWSDSDRPDATVIVTAGRDLTIAINDPRMVREQMARAA